MHYTKLVGVGLCGLLSFLISTQLFAQEDVVKKRKEFMEKNYDELKAIKKAVEEKDYATIQVKAREIMGNMDTLVDYFPKNSITEKSRAKPEIWEKFDEFKKLPVKVKDVADGLAKAAAAKDEARVQTQFKALGSESPFRSGACYECHKDFRNNPPPVKKTEG
jgi:cytochrome c556